MCLSIPAQIKEINGDLATVSVGGTEVTASLQLITDVNVGDYVLVHTGFAIQKISEEDAAETMKIVHALGEIDEQLKAEGL